MSGITYNPISLKEAEKVTEAWRMFYANIIEESDPNSPKVFRGFTIPISDLQNLVKIADGNPEITGVRAYIAKGDCPPNGDGEVAGDKIHIVLLPITGDAESTSGAPKTRDLYEKDGKSLIYDFTTPCPELCDFNSKLYKKEE